ncbi:IclR family transcriptional regulator [Candidatus Pseudothioglobus singularis]|jgi:DNA-binding IclR family transcriptional regulator|nr:IclR family transcriptional regulator [Candidatus Pseudothioglobus singularis]MDC0599388.1 IclR family transcriptional regulator [Candidatus Pseudothioglobus singularis]MDC3216403.1 IclR family transcriptional regulator [Candidatus Pseudothioglobus singularis]MDG1167311.1 IclR family transcriptional regulator [Candidatus Thioglobus sp.]|tara:strand:- start:1798 stop:2589 length:792 start_codon:yes stop_codon:yes gene_type:complete
MTIEKRGDGTVGKALDVLSEVAEIGSPVRFSSLLKTSKYPKATLYRLLQTLLNQDMLSYNEEEQTYKLGLKLVRMAHSAWLQSSLAPVAVPFIDELSAKVGETVHLAELDNGQVLYVDKRNPASPIEMYSQAGKVGPAYCTGVGKAMMAFLEESELSKVISKQAFFKYTDHTITSEKALRKELTMIKKEGISFDRQEHEEKIICISSPILTSNGRVIGGLSITSSIDIHSLESLEKYKPELLATSEQIGKEAGAWSFPEKSIN